MMLLTLGIFVVLVILVFLIIFSSSIFSHYRTGLEQRRYSTLLQEIPAIFQKNIVSAPFTPLGIGSSKNHEEKPFSDIVYKFSKVVVVAENLLEDSYNGQEDI